MNKDKTYFGYVAIIGSPNVGKSTLINKLVNNKISITSNRAQTTRNRVIGIYTEGKYQIVYIDTPGFNIEKKHIINKIANKLAINSINNVELIIYVVERNFWKKSDEFFIKKIINSSIPVILIVNKIDKIKEKNILLPYLQYLSKKMNFLDIIPISALTGYNISLVKEIIKKHIPESIHFFSNKKINEKHKKFIITEIIREKVIRLIGDELPYNIIIKIEYFLINEKGSYNIGGLIFVERKGQKKIVIGNKGSKIRIIGIKARKEIQNILKAPVNLNLWVKLKSDWNNNILINNIDLFEDIYYPISF